MTDNIDYKELFLAYKHVCGGYSPEQIAEALVLHKAQHEGRVVVFEAAPKPLTLEQLKLLEGKPYYHVSLQGNPNHWAIMEKYIAQ